MKYPKYYYDIKRALQQGYIVNVKLGEVTGLKGRVLSTKTSVRKRYATVSLVSIKKNGEKIIASVPIHKVIAYKKYGNKAFEPGVHVRHIDGNSKNNKGSNIRLGTSSENQLDKPKESRVLVAKLARKAQGIKPHNYLLTDIEVLKIRKILKKNLNEKGRVKRGVIKRLISKYRVSKSTISMLGKYQTYKDVK